MDLRKSTKLGRKTAEHKTLPQPNSRKRKLRSDSLDSAAGETHSAAHLHASGADPCPICLNDSDKPTATRCCGQKFCSSCLEQALCVSPYCPTCRTPLRQIIGNQPPGTMTTSRDSTPLPGYNGCGTITIRYSIPSGTQGPGHPHPGSPFSGTERLAYLPDNTEGQEALKLLTKAWEAKLIFTVGTSHTTGVSNTVVWNDIHHKTCRSGEPFGYPDMTYLSRLKEELASRGIVLQGEAL
ncbi:hypothetical protein EMCRGX_G029364 [Ephydatia muelleri]